MLLLPLTPVLRPRQSAHPPAHRSRTSARSPWSSALTVAVAHAAGSPAERILGSAVQHIHFIEFLPEEPLRLRVCVGTRCWTGSSLASVARCTQRLASGPAGETRRSIVDTLSALRRRRGTKRRDSAEFALQGGVGGCIHSARQCNRARHAPQTMCALDGRGGARGIGRISERPRIWRGV